MPSDPAAFLKSTLASERPARSKAHGGIGRGLAYLAAAAVLALIVWRNMREDPDGGGLTPVEEIAFSLQESDLAALYYEITTARDDPWTCPSPEELAAGLAETYDCCRELRVSPHAAEVFEGPFDSTLWPGGTILTGAAEGQTAILIAELDTTHRCRVLPTLAQESGLQVFTWQVGDLVLTEVTPLSEPRLLDYFEWRP